MPRIIILLAILVSSTAYAQIPMWEPTGGPFGGDITGLSSSSRTVFAATTRGLYRSTNSGATWDLTLEDLRDETFLDVFAAPRGFVAAGSGWISQDDGLTWSIGS